MKQKIALDTIIKNTRAMIIENGVMVDEGLFQSAFGKTKRWMRNAYGEIDWCEYLNECGNFYALYIESILEPDGKNTFNRMAYNNRRPRR
jgi:hypothetical protein